MGAKPNKVLAAAEAIGLWKLYGFTSPKELVLEDLAMARGILVMDGKLDSAAARLVRSGDTGIVRVSHSIREPGRRRFAIAHEIGHWELHQKQSQLLACTDEDMLGPIWGQPVGGRGEYLRGFTADARAPFRRARERPATHAGPDE